MSTLLILTVAGRCDHWLIPALLNNADTERGITDEGNLLKLHGKSLKRYYITVTKGLVYYSIISCNKLVDLLLLSSIHLKAEYLTWARTTCSRHRRNAVQGAGWRDEWWIGMDVKSSGLLGYFKVPSQHFPGGTENNHAETCQDLRAEIRTRDLPNSNHVNATFGLLRKHNNTVSTALRLLK
jgi:hypothetical protein